MACRPNLEGNKYQHKANKMTNLNEQIEEILERPDEQFWGDETELAKSIIQQQQQVIEMLREAIDSVHTMATGYIKEHNNQNAQWKLYELIAAQTQEALQQTAKLMGESDAG